MIAGAVDMLTNFGNKCVVVSYDSEFDRMPKKFGVTVDNPSPGVCSVTICTDEPNDLRRLAKYLNSVADFAEGR